MSVLDEVRPALPQKFSDRNDGFASDKNSTEGEVGEVQRASRYDLVRALAPRCAHVGKLEKGQLLDEVCQLTGYTRKRAVALLKHPPPDEPVVKRMRHRSASYPAEVELLQLCWPVTDGICGKRLAPFLPELLRRLRHWHALRDVPADVQAAQRTRDTYLAALRPWFGFLAERRFAWNAVPEEVREHTRQFLLEAGCVLQRGSVEGWFIRATHRTPISPNGLHVLLAALRNFYDVMIRGVWVPEDRRSYPLYPYENPMYSRLLLAWRHEHRKWIRNAGAPDYAGIRSETHAETTRQPVGFFQMKRQPLEPPVARDAEPVRLLILAAVRYMIDHAASRDSLIMRILLESGARVSEVLSMTAGGVRHARNPHIGIDVKALVCNNGDHYPSKPIWFSDDTRERLFRYIARARSRYDPRQRRHLDELGEDEPIFLSNRKRQLGYSGFLTCFKRLVRQAQRHFQSAPTGSSVRWFQLPDITPHTIRHLHTTFRVKDIRTRFSSKAEREAAFDALVGDMGWRTAEMLKVYDHAITQAEMKEQMAHSVHEWVENAPSDRGSLDALLRGVLTDAPQESSERGPAAFVLTDTAREGLAWLEDLGQV